MNSWRSELVKWVETHPRLLDAGVNAVVRLSPADRVPDSVVFDIDTDTHVSQITVWKSGDLFGECAEVRSGEFVHRVQLESADEQSIREAISELIGCVLNV